MAMRLTEGGRDGVVVKVRDGAPPFTWLVNGVPIRYERFTRSARWIPDGRGFATVSVVDGPGRSDRVRVYME